jgi:transcriptional regulator with XRE-family HTH domain
VARARVRAASLSVTGIDVKILPHKFPPGRRREPASSFNQTSCPWIQNSRKSLASIVRTSENLLPSSQCALMIGSMDADRDLAGTLAKNVKQLREARGLTQQQISKLAGVPRATWAHVESGEANPTLSVLHRVATALQVSIEELLSAPRSVVRHYAKGSLPVRTPGQATVRKLLPDAIAGMEIDRIELPANGRMTGVPHTPGTREYLTVESGEIQLIVGGEKFLAAFGDVVVFRGDQRHSYHNPGRDVAVGYSVVVLAHVD